MNAPNLFTRLNLKWASPVAQQCKSVPAMQETQETWIRSLGREDSLKEGMRPTPVFLPGESHGERGLAGYSPWGHKELDTTEVTEHAHELQIPSAYFYGANILRDDDIYCH